MSVQKSSEETSAPNKKSGWINEVNYSSLVKEAAFILRKNFKTLLATSVLIALTGGQSLTMNSSLFGSGNSTSGIQNQTNSNVNSENGNADFQSILNKIENEENVKTEINNFLQNKEMVRTVIVVASSILLFIFICAFLTFLYNSHLHLLFFKKLNFLLQGKIPEKKLIKAEVKGKWKKVALLRLIFGLLKIASAIVFFLPALFFALEKNWGKVILLGLLALSLVIFVLIFLSYIYRISLLYFLEANLSIKESVDKGYELFGKKWKQIVLGSLINFALHVVFGLGAFLLILAFVLICLIISGLIGLLIFLAVGKAYLTTLAIILGIILVLTPTLLFAIILSALWQSFVMIFWFLIFREIAGVKVAEIVAPEVVLTEEKKEVREAVNKEMTNVE